VSEARLELHVVGADAAPQRLPDSGMLVLGASAERAGLVVAGQGVDDAHCAIGPVKGGGWAIKDLGSRYGTIVNGKKVATARLAAGDTILIGSRRLRIVDPEAPPEPEQRPAAAPRAESAGFGVAVGLAEVADEAVVKGGVGIPKKIGGYRVDRLLGRGAMGMVLLAEQESLHRPVALKLLPPRLAADQAFVQRFQKEARAAAALNHPNVVVVHDVGASDGFHFLSMEYMERGSLEDRLRIDGRIPWREVLDVLHDAARGLMFAEEKRIIHRDIKPANLMQNAAGTIKIADLGLATHVEAEASEADGKKILGTPHFIAPEQARGEAIDHRADLYSLGATAYHLLTGRTPFEGETTRDILRGHFTLEPKPLSEFVPAIPAGLEALVLRLLAKTPAERPQSADVLLAEVDRLRLQADHGVAVGAGGKKGSKLPLIAGGAVAVLALAAFALMRAGGGEPGGTNGNGAILAGGGGEDPNAGGNTPRSGAGGPNGTGDEGVLGGPRAGADSGGATAADLEAQLRERNLLAENAYLRVDPALAPEDRVALLEGLVEQYPGTDTAGRAQNEIQALRAGIAAAEVAAAQLAVALGDAVARLRRACALPTPETELPRPGQQLRTAASFAMPPEVQASKARAVVGSVEDEIVAAAIARFAAELERVDALAADGSFAEIEALLDDLLPRFDLPDFEPGSAPARLDELLLQGDAVRGRLARLPSERRLWSEHRTQADRTAIASALRGAGRVRAALETLDCDGAIAALDTLQTKLGTPERRAFASALRGDLEAAKAAIAGLAKSFAEGSWRRRSVLDPRGGRPTTRDAIGLDAGGVHVDVKGTAELVPWAAFARSTESMVQLFKERLDRGYTENEIAGAVGLLRITCALEAAALAEPVLEPGSNVHFSPAEESALLGLYAAPEDWVQRAPRFQRERKAAEVLARALRDLEGGIWSSAEAGLTLLLDEYADTLLVELLSDGEAWSKDG
jgi:serine/threonine-protein kinase